MKRPVRFLLVEDNPDHAELVRLSLQGLETSPAVEHVPDGASALDRLRDGTPLPDLVLLDLQLPDGSGIDVLKAIKGEPALQMVPVVILSTSSAEQDRHAAYAASANSFVVKPVDFTSALDVLKDVGRYWSRCNITASQRDGL